MPTPKQKELINTFISQLSNDAKQIYEPVVEHLLKLGYVPKKVRENIAFTHPVLNKYMVKMGIKKGKHPVPFLALRFSACRDYSQRFADIVKSPISKYPHKIPGCLENKCSWCLGEPESHIYSYTFPDSETKYHCGAYVPEIPNISLDDVPEILKLITEQDKYFQKYS
ncbi:MAG: hypothetical protein FWG98_07250 [Candidatus Cloacimonetes bacterium]|nr:hypothetical protein [Candidatus Cloacimonadota bacterium]